MSYGNGISGAYNHDDSSLAVTTNMKFSGPKNAQGRLISLSAYITTVTASAEAILSLGIESDLTKYGTLTIPVGSAVDTVVNDFVHTVETIEANEALRLHIPGTGTVTGAAALSAVIEWFGGDAS